MTVYEAILRQIKEGRVVIFFRNPLNKLSYIITQGYMGTDKQVSQISDEELFGATPMEEWVASAVNRIWDEPEAKA